MVPSTTPIGRACPLPTMSIMTSIFVARKFKKIRRPTGFAATFARAVMASNGFSPESSVKVLFSNLRINKYYNFLSYFSFARL